MGGRRESGEPKTRRERSRIEPRQAKVTEWHGKARGSPNTPGRGPGNGTRPGAFLGDTRGKSGGGGCHVTPQRGDRAVRLRQRDHRTQDTRQRRNQQQVDNSRSTLVVKHCCCQRRNQCCCSFFPRTTLAAKMYARCLFRTVVGTTLATATVTTATATAVSSRQRQDGA